MKPKPGPELPAEIPLTEQEVVLSHVLSFVSPGHELPAMEFEEWIVLLESPHIPK